MLSHSHTGKQSWMMMMVSQCNGTSTPKKKKGHTVPKQVITIATSIQVTTV